MDTSKEAYEAAADRLDAAMNARDQAVIALRKADQEVLDANMDLVRHEAKPGIPAYMQATS